MNAELETLVAAPGFIDLLDFEEEEEAVEA